MNTLVQAYKLARPNGWDFYTGKTINYRSSVGTVVQCPNGNAKLAVCSAGVIHASKNPNDCFVGANIPCSAYRVEGKPVCGDEEKWGFLELNILEEIMDLDTLFGWKYTEACNPVNPLTGRAKKPTQEDIELLRKWDSVRSSVWSIVWASVGDPVWSSVWSIVWASVGDSVWASVWASVGDSVWASVGDSVWASVGDSVWASVRDSVRDSVWASIGSLFPNIKRWEDIEHKHLGYPFQSAVDLWRRGFVPSYDGQTWRLHSGKTAEVVYEWKEGE